MKPLLSFFTFILLTITTLHAQGDRLVDSTGRFKYQYNRTILNDVNDSRRAVVTFVFINGDEQTAISYRQEVLDGTLTWLNTNKGTVSREKLVEVITANLAPKETLVWKFAFQNKPLRKDGRTAVEKAALMILNSGFEAEKIIFDEKLSDRPK